MYGNLESATRFFGTGLTLVYSQRDFFAPGTDARFRMGYFNDPYAYNGAPQRRTG